VLVSRSICLIGTIVAIGVTLSCAAKIPSAAPESAFAQRLAMADDLLTAGCAECFASAYRGYDALRVNPAVRDVATAGAIQAAMLTAVRDAEFGNATGPSADLAHALVHTADSPWSSFLEIADTLPTSPRDTSDREFERWQFAFRNRQVFAERLRARANESAVSAYLWIAFNCAYGNLAEPTLDDWLAVIPAWKDTPLIQYKAASCGGQRDRQLQDLLESDARFVEVNYTLGLHVLQEQPDAAIAYFHTVYAWRPTWPLVTDALAHAYFAVDDFEASLMFFDRTLEIAPGWAEARLGKGRALTQLGLAAQAIASFDELLAGGRWYVGDARYWRAVNETQLQRYDDAWTDVEDAAKFLRSADVPKLAGIIAVRRGQFEVARTKFEEAQRRDAKDCETEYDLGLVHTELRNWTGAADTLSQTVVCLDSEDQQLAVEMTAIRAADMPEARRAQQIARHERQLVTNRRWRTTSWFNTAVAYFYLSRPKEASAYAERVVDDEQFGTRARELLSRLH
jgi:tetratricopeptide (TPR) repeat protein